MTLRLAYSLADQFFLHTSSMGIFKFSIGLLQALSQREDLGQLYLFSNETIRAEIPTDPRVSNLEKNEAIRGPLGRLAWENWGVYRAAQECSADWLLLPKGFMSLVVRPPLPVVSYVHDLIVVKYAQAYGTARDSIRSQYFGRALSATLRNARLILTNTRFTKGEILHWATSLGIHPPPIVVAGYGIPGVSSEIPRKKDQIVLLVRRDPHKRSELAIEFLQRWLRHAGYKGQVICIGSLPPRVAILPSGWVWHERLMPEHFQQLTRESRALVHFSEYEGFGMPPVEAMMWGTSPVYSDVPATLEATGGRGFPFSNDSFASFADAMEGALTASDDMLAVWRGELSELHNWTKVATSVMDALQRFREPARSARAPSRPPWQGESVETGTLPPRIQSRRGSSGPGVHRALPSLSIGLVTWNSAAWLPRCLDGIEAQGYPDVELIVVDNASADASVDLVQRRFPAARILQNDANRGFAVAQNAAIRATHGEYYLALNPDVALLPGFLELLITALEAHPECGSACGKLLQATDEQPPILDGAGLFLDRARHQYLRGRGEPDTGQYDQPGEVFGADGAAALYRRAMLDDIQIQGEYFDEAFFAYMEDVDLAWRARLMGWYCWYEPAATAYHERAFKPGRRLTMPPGMRRWAVRNRYLMLLKNEGREEFRRDWWRILAYDLGIWAYILVLEQSSLGAIRLVRQQLSQTREWRRTIWQAVRAPPATRMSWFNQAGGPKV